MQNKKLAIVTFHDAINFGAFLQAYALYNFLSNAGYNVDLLNYENVDFLKDYSTNILKRKGLKRKLGLIKHFIFNYDNFISRVKKGKQWKECLKNEFTFSRVFCNENMSIINEYYDYFIAGSDQVWNLKIIKENYVYLLDFVTDSNKKKSYAASLGNLNLDDREKNILKSKLSHFSSILVRESGSEKMLATFNINSHVVMDPTFLLSKDEWKQFADKSNLELPKKYIFIYLVAEQNNLYSAAIKYAEEKGFEIILLGTNNVLEYDGGKVTPLIDCNPYDFMKLILNAEAVFTTSYHGLILSVNINKRVYYELNQKINNNNERILDIVKNLGLEFLEIKEKRVNDEVINWDNVNSRISGYISESKRLLIKSLK